MSGGLLARDDELVAVARALDARSTRRAVLVLGGQIAETLWVTLKTVEVHLGRSYNKLGISSRRELAGSLGLTDDAQAA
jgi:hypothetical protein